MFLKLRDPMSGLTHFIGAISAIVGLVFLLLRSNSVLTTVAFSIFGIGMILLYTASTLYHWLPISGEKLKLFRKIDHIMIFVFIAATYTPICLVTLQGIWGWSLFGCVWGIALAGLFMKLFWLNAPRKLYTSIYLLMGWIITIALYPLSQKLESIAFVWLGLGALFYTVGALIYAFKQPDPWPKVFGFHEIFHVFIMLGSFSLYWLIYNYV